jgi:hypothetical protein
MKTILALLAAALLSGCAATTFENYVATSLAGDRAAVVMRFGPVGVALDLREADAMELQVMRLKAEAKK